MTKLEQYDTLTMTALATLLIDQLPAAIAAAREKAIAGAGPLSPSRFLEAWRDELAQEVESAISSTRVVAAIPMLFAVCEIGIEMREGRSGIHIRGSATSALDTTLRIMKAHDSACGTAVGEALIAMMLANLAHRWFDAEKQRGSCTVH